MKQLIKIQSVLFFLIYFADIYSSISIVYNLKIAETTKRQAFEKNGTHPSIIALTPFNQFRNKYTGDRHNYGGSLFSYIYTPENFYARVDWAFAQVNANKGTFVKTETDDLLFSAGYSFSLNNRSKCTISGLFGVPTHKDLTVLEPQFGYAHIGIGSQIDGSFVFSKYNNDHSFRCAARVIHFFKRTTCIPLGTFQFNLGNLIDLYVALHINAKRNRFEIGYNPTFLCSATISPSLTDAVKKSNYKRNSFFGVYKYRFKLRNQPSVAALALSYGFDFEPKEFGNKRIVTVWGSWTISF